MVAALFIVFIVCLAIGVPVGFSLGISSLVYFLGAGMPLQTYGQNFFAGLDSFTLLCIPGFTLAGNLMNEGGISDKLMDFCDKIVGHLTGGLAYANIMASAIFAGISGTALSDTVALGSIEIPMMVNAGYDTDYSVAVTCISSCLGPIIPPSVPMIMAATMTGLSVSRMFVAGIVPGLLMAAAMAIPAYLIAKKKNYPKRDRRSTFKEVLKSGKEAIWAILMTLIILFGIIGGVFTPTEASIVCIVYGIIVGFFIYKKLTLKSFYQCLQQTLSSAASIMALVAFAKVFAYILTKEQIPAMIADAMLSFTSNKFILLLLINIFLLFVGMFMETIAAILILFPVLLSIAKAVGVDAIQFGVMVVMNLVIGLDTPPVGVCLFAATNIAGNKLSDNVKALAPFLIACLAVLLLVTYVPAITAGVATLILG